MKQTISTMNMRKNLGDILNRVDLRHDQFVIERKGKPLAALIPIVLWEQIQNSAKTYALEFLRSRPSELSDEEAMELATKTKKRVRRKP
jgi:prevent-host-death family protein